MTEEQELFLVIASVLAVQNGKVLLLKRIDTEHFGGLFAPPGGRLKPNSNETTRQAAQRELLEETGLIPTSPLELFCEFRFNRPSTGQPGVGFRYWCTVFGDIQLSPEFSEYRWAGLDDLDKLPVINQFREDLVRFFASGILTV